MATMKSVFPLAMMLIVLVAQNQFMMAQSQAQSCSASFGNLNVCAPFLVPGAPPTPSADCCGALKAIDHDCWCNSLRIASRIPAQCNLPALSCAN